MPRWRRDNEMPEFNWVLLAGIEFALLLICACLFLLFHVRDLRTLISALEARVLLLRDVVRGARSDASSARRELAEMRRQSRDFGDYLEEQIAATRNQHLSLQPDRDIVLDIAPDSPSERQALALRYALLIAEKESWEATGGKGCDWEVLSAKLGAIIDFYRQHESQPTVDGEPASVQAIDGLRRQVANLERFRQLYFDGEKRWRDASTRADGYLEELRALGQSLGGGSDFDMLLQQYHEVYADLGKLLTHNPESEPQSGPKSQLGAPAARIVVNQEEVNRLRNMAVDQHKMILQLKKQLAGAQTVEQKDAVIAELQKQLERQERFLKESEICSKLLEDELNRAIDENQSLRQQLVDAAAGDAEQQEMQQLVAELTRESREMLGAITVLEEENRRLQAQLPKSGAEAGGAVGDIALREQLQLVQGELQSLQQRYTELEERYLALKMQ
jgi:hypothetical protein